MPGGLQPVAEIATRPGSEAAHLDGKELEPADLSEGVAHGGAADAGQRCTPVGKSVMGYSTEAARSVH